MTPEFSCERSREKDGIRVTIISSSSESERVASCYFLRIRSMLSAYAYLRSSMTWSHFLRSSRESLHYRGRGWWSLDYSSTSEKRSKSRPSILRSSMVGRMSSTLDNSQIHRGASDMQVFRLCTVRILFSTLFRDQQRGLHGWREISHLQNSEVSILRRYPERHSEIGTYHFYHSHSSWASQEGEGDFSPCTRRML